MFQIILGIFLFIIVAGEFFGEYHDRRIRGDSVALSLVSGVISMVTLLAGSVVFGITLFGLMYYLYIS